MEKSVSLRAWNVVESFVFMLQINHEAEYEGKNRHTQSYKDEIQHRENKGRHPYFLTIFSRRQRGKEIYSQNLKPLELKESIKKEAMGLSLQFKSFFFFFLR